MSKTKLITKNYLHYRDQHAKQDKRIGKQQKLGELDEEESSSQSPTPSSQILDYYDFNNSYYLQPQNYTIENFIQNLHVDYYEYQRDDHFENDHNHRHNNKYAAFQKINAEYNQKMMISQEQAFSEVSQVKSGKASVLFSKQQKVKYFKDEDAPECISFEEGFIESFDDQQQDLSNDCCL